VASRLIVAITGASGAIYGVRALEILQRIPEIETHLIISRGGKTTIAQELDVSFDEVRAMASVVHPEADISATISSGSYRTMGMLIAPCSVKTLSGVANSYDDGLVTRSADVVLKERLPLVLLFRETPLHGGHIRLMWLASQAGAVVMPPVPAFYHRPQTVDEIIDQTVGRALDQFGIDSGVVNRWPGPSRK
jgi:flavin prenyltransferase